MSLESKLQRINDKNIASFVMDLKLSDNITETQEGYLKCENSIFGRTGFQTYYGRELVGMGFGDDELVKVFRDEADVFHTDSLESANGKPVTLDHPDFDVDVKNFKDLSRGHISGTPKRVGDNVVGTVIITDMEAIELVKNKKVRELSLGYRTKLVRDGDFVKQTNIRINHLALVENGRAGVSRIVDSKEKEGVVVVDKKELLDNVLKSKGNTINIYLDDKKEKVVEKKDKDLPKQDIEKKEGVVVENEVKDTEKEVKVEKEIKDTKTEKEVLEKEIKEKGDESVDKKVKDAAIELLKGMSKEEISEILGNDIKDSKEKDNKLNDKMFGEVKKVDNQVEKETKLNDYAGFTGDELKNALQDEYDKFRPHKLEDGIENANQRDKKIGMMKTYDIRDMIKGGR